MTAKIYPSYLKAHRTGRLDEKIERLEKRLSACDICPRKCGANRLRGKTGYCGAGEKAKVSSYCAHFGEESCLAGKYGSGTIFFSHCSLKCVFCQNYKISSLAEGSEVSPEELASFMLELQNQGCHNINLVTPTHFVPQILGALKTAAGIGLNLPLVYNCGGYESEETIEMLDGIIDIYMPDVKFSSPDAAGKFCGARDYFPNLKKILKLMHRQVGDLKIENGIAGRGLLVRHLVMPNGLAGTGEIMEFIAKEISENTFINIMDQYRPCWEACKYPEINRAITGREYQQARETARSSGLKNFL